MRSNKCLIVSAAKVMFDDLGNKHVVRIGSVGTTPPQGGGGGSADAGKDDGGAASSGAAQDTISSKRKTDAEAVRSTLCASIF